MLENLTEFIKRRNNIITNIDPDGFFSFAILNKFFGSKLVGFTNSKEYVYLADGKDTRRENVTYVDMYVAPNDLQSIDQHIVSYNEKENEFYQNLGTKLNPNVWHNRSFENYKIKYPFSTFIYLCTLLDKEGYDLNIDWHRKITDELELGHILLRIDGVLTNLADYQNNCVAWLKWTTEFTSNGKFVQGLQEFIKTSVSVIETKNISRKVEDFFKNTFQSESKDGGYKEIRKDNFQQILQFIKFAFQLLDSDWDDKFDSFTIYRGDKVLGTPMDFENRQKNIFSCAVVSMRENNFSYTTNIVKYNQMFFYE